MTNSCEKEKIIFIPIGNKTKVYNYSLIVEQYTKLILSLLEFIVVLLES